MPSAETIGTFDYVIVGDGSAGCVLANRLSVHPEVRVLLLEAGGQDNYFWIHIPVGYLFTMNNPRTDWCFRSDPEPHLNGRSLGYPRGKTLGGCSSINGMIYMRGQAADYDHWRQLGNAGWSWEDVLPYFKHSEDFAHGADEMHGIGGEWRVEEQRLSWEILDGFREAALQAGIPYTDDFNRGDNEGCGYFQVNQKRGVRWSASKAFLRPALGRKNLTVITRAHASRVVFDDGCAVAIEFERDGSRVRAATAGEVILSAGSINSPHLLQLSGVGPGGLLQEHGIPVVHDLGGVGQNLQDHLQVRMVYEVSGTRTLNERANSLIGRLTMAAEYALFRSGPLSMAPSQLGCFAKSDPALATPNLEYHLQPLSTDKLGSKLHSFPGFTASVCNLRPESRGHVRLVDPDPRSAPSIAPNYLTQDSDRKVALDAVRLTRRICSMPGLERFSPAERKPGATIVGEEDLLSAIGDIGTTIFHPVGTCKMGSDEKGVVDDRLRVRGVEKLRVVDASVMPTITSGNTNSPVIMIAEKAAEMIQDDAKTCSR